MYKDGRPPSRRKTMDCNGVRVYEPGSCICCGAKIGERHDPSQCDAYRCDRCFGSLSGCKCKSRHVTPVNGGWTCEEAMCVALGLAYTDAEVNANWEQSHKFYHRWVTLEMMRHGPNVGLLGDLVSGAMPCLRYDLTTMADRHRLREEGLSMLRSEWSKIQEARHA